MHERFLGHAGKKKKKNAVKKTADRSGISRVKYEFSLIDHQGDRRGDDS